MILLVLYVHNINSIKVKIYKSTSCHDQFRTCMKLILNIILYELAFAIIDDG